MEAPRTHVIVAHAEPGVRAATTSALTALRVPFVVTPPEAALAKMREIFAQEPGSSLVLVHDASDERRKAALRAGAFEVLEGPLSEARMRSLLQEAWREAAPFA